MGLDRRGVVLSAGQRRLWLADQAAPGSLAYSTPLLLRLKGLVRPDVLASVLTTIVARHEILRTTFAMVDGLPVQVIGPGYEVALPVVDCLAGGVQEAIQAELAEPFDLSRGPLIRARLILTGTEQSTLVLNMHHIVTDGWSTGVIQDEIAALYPAFSQGEPSPLPDLPRQYADFAVWQENELTAQRRTELETYWQQRLAGAPAYMRLPYDRARPATPSWQGQTWSFTLGADLGTQLRTLARAEGATLFMVLLAAYKMLLHEVTGETDIVVATPAAGRGHPSLDTLIGFFVNNLVLRTDLSGNPSFRDAIRRVRDTVLDAHDHQDLPFDMLVTAIRPTRIPHQTPFLQTSLVYQPEPIDEYRIGDLVATPAQAPLPGSALDLAFSIFDGASIEVQVSYQCDLFDESTIRTLSQEFVGILRRGSDEPGKPMDHGRAGQSPYHQGRSIFGPERPELLGLNLADQLADVVDRQTNAPAVTHLGKTLTYSELDTASGAVSKALSDLGVGAGDIVGLALDPGIDLVVAVVATVRIGAAYLCLDPAAPEGRNDWIAQDAGCRVVVSPSAASAGLSYRLTAHAKSRSVAPHHTGEPQPQASPGHEVPSHRDRAYVVYTSGSTGAPKGVGITQDAVCNWALGMGAEMGVGPATNIVQLAATSFDVMSAEIWLALLHGAKLSIISGDERYGTRALIAALNREAVTFYIGTPGPLAGIDPSEVPLLTTIVVGGDAVPDILIKTWLPHAQVAQVYGASEGTMCTTVGLLDAASPANAAGRPMANSAIYLLSPSLDPVPLGGVGEIYIGGTGVGQEYLGQPALTAERFLPDPIASRPGSRMYRTGDLGRISANGDLEFVGRADDMVKINGVRVEPAEVEAAITALDDVTACAVVADLDTHGAVMLRAFVIPSAVPDEMAIRSQLRRTLPTSMIPQAMTFVSSFPLTPNGKVDRRQLLELEPSAPRSMGQETLPEAMSLVAAVWQDVLGRDSIATTEDFFDLGGDSLGAARVIARLEGIFAVHIGFSDFLANRTIYDIVRHIEGLRGVSRRPPPVPRPDLDRRGAVLSAGQRRLWLADQAAPGSLAYSTPLLLRLKGLVRPDVLGSVLTAVVARHEVLRSTFAMAGGLPVQVVGPGYQVALPVVDCLAGGAQEAIQAELSVPFDLSQGPLLRARLFLTGVEESTLVLNMHHIVTDGWSTGVLQDEIATLYSAFCQDEPSPLPDLELQYADYAVWQESSLTAERRQELETYWRQQLSGAPAYMRLPYNRARPAVPSWQGQTWSFALDADLGTQLRTLARAEGATLFMVLLAAYKMLLHEVTGETDIVVATPAAGRGHPSLDTLIGFFVNNLVLRTDLSGNPSFRETIRRVRDTVLGAHDHQDLPFDMLITATRPTRIPHQTPFTELWFHLLPVDKIERVAGDLVISPGEEAEQRGNVRHDFTLEAEIDDDTFNVLISTRASLYTEAEVAEMVATLKELLTAGLAAPDRQPA